MTNHWVDIKNANLVVVMGGNAAEAHPVGFRWAMEAKIHNGAKLIVIDPRFTRTASVADFYTPIRSGTDITFLSGVILYLLNNEKFNREYTEAYTNASLIVREDYSFDDGLFSGYNAEKRQYDKTSWNYEAGRKRLRQTRYYAATSALRLEPAEAACFPLYPGCGRKHLRYAEGRLPQSL